MGVGVFAASVDPLDKALEIAKNLPFPVAWGVTRADAEAIDAWWEERRQIIQPSEFVIDANGKIISSTYSDGAIGRMDAADVIKVLQFRERQLQKK